jgi:serine/threonine protein kinase
VLSALGAGGMGEVYKARDTRLERTVAIKVLPAAMSSSAEARQRFEREARTISQLSHPHIFPLHDVGHQDGTDYLVMMAGTTSTWAISARPEDRSEVGTPRVLFQTRVKWSDHGTQYDVSLDGSRFLVNSLVDEGKTESFTVVENLTAGLKK